MHPILLRTLFTGLVIVCLVGITAPPSGVQAQDAATPAATQTATQTATEPADCGSVVTDAQALIAQQCGNTGRNKLCYGNIALKAQPQPGITDFKFSAPGDTVDVLNVQQLELSALDIAAGTWGLAIMRIQANLPDTATGQNVTVLLFGDVHLQNAFEPPSVTVQVTTLKPVNVSKLPGAVTVGRLDANATVSSTGRLKDGSWLRVVLPGKAGQADTTGWVFASAITPSGSVDALAVVDTRAPVYGPMQAFYFRSGVGEAACKDAPPDGILVQTPKGVGKITLVIDEVKIALGSTVYIVAQPSKELIIYTLEGSAQVQAFGQAQTAVAGTRVRVPLDANLKASGPPLPAEPYSGTALQALPIQSLPVSITIAPPRTASASTKNRKLCGDAMHAGNKAAIALYC